ncbi:beta-ketoacyl-ACP synthase III [Nakamurella deserti]|uniref:beta-ketoacyl-ACP synthase III n=1 Tax=Nakamurella deserti TaxID=2164074 RepID=UPI000DBE8BC6|nr:beta-ketoacyl-ACP synthase III [Nakamurella deserti]
MTASIARRDAPAGTRIAGMGYHRPERVVTNDELSTTMDTNDEWIRTRVGIQERRWASATETAVFMGAEAGRKAIADAGLTAADIDTVIVATCSLPTQVPHAATQIARDLGIHAPGSFDLNAACAGFCYGLAVASHTVRAGAGKNVLLVGVDKLTDWTDLTDRSTAIIFADAAGAVVVTGSDTEEIGPVSWGSDETQTQAIHIADRNSSMYQDGQAVFRWATTQIAPVGLRAVEAAGLEMSDIDAVVTHQANLRIIDAIAKRLNAAGARPDVHIARDIVTTGNTSSASVPVALCRARDEGSIVSGDLVLSVGFGAGLTFAGQVYRVP